MSKYGDYRICFSNDLSDPKNQVTIIGDKGPLRQFQKQMDKWRGARKKAEEYEAKNKELLEELKYLKKVNDDLVWQRDTDEEHEAKAQAFDEVLKSFDESVSVGHMADDVCNIVNDYRSESND